MFTHASFWQKVPSGQGVSFLEHVEFTPPLHSFALQEDMSVAGITGAINPSEQNPAAQTWPIGQWLFARQGSLAEAPDILGAGWTFEFLEICMATNAITAITKNAPSKLISFIASSRTREIKDTLVTDSSIKEGQLVFHKIHSYTGGLLDMLEGQHHNVYQVDLLESPL